jgi:Flp pilus assembly protein TadG
MRYLLTHRRRIACHAERSEASRSGFLASLGMTCASLKKDRYRHRSEGQALVIVALAFLVLIAFLGLAIDGANAFGQRRRVNNAADAASLAATRVLIDVKSHNGLGDQINATIREFLINDHNITAADSTWEASYVSRNEPDTIIAPVRDDQAPPSEAEGVRIEVSYTFDTAFMRVMGQRTLTVGAISTSVYGPLGTGIGEDLIPLGISDSALNTLLSRNHIRVDLRGRIMDDYNHLAPGQQMPEEIADVVTDANFAHVDLSDTPPEDLPNPNGCQNPNVHENLSYWWCNGTQTMLRLGRSLPTVDTNWGEINSSIIHRVFYRPTAVVPVYVQLPNGHGGIKFQLAYFVAVDLDYDVSMSVVTMTLRRDYVSAGAMIGEGSGVITGVWAVNLKR